MSWYSNHVLPRIVDVMCGASSSEPLRQRTCSELTGRVVEIGFGSGLNVPHYPAAVSSVDAIEPSDVAWRLAAKRVNTTQIDIERTARDAQQLPYGDDTFDCAVSTWTMCTIPDVSRALDEVHRVLKPGGTLHFVEHGLAPDANVQRWQHRLEPLQKRFAGGCHFTREISALLEDAGFVITEVDIFYESGRRRSAAPTPSASQLPSAEHSHNPTKCRGELLGRRHQRTTYGCASSSTHQQFSYECRRSGDGLPLLHVAAQVVTLRRTYRGPGTGKSDREPLACQRVDVSGRVADQGYATSNWHGRNATHRSGPQHAAQRYLVAKTLVERAHVCQPIVK
jgi:SAM-dependent methyltransferase